MSDFWKGIVVATIANIAAIIIVRYVDRELMRGNLVSIKGGKA